jgi:hypothetical protein
LDIGTVVPHSSPAVIRAAMARRRFVFMLYGYLFTAQDLSPSTLS